MPTIAELMGDDHDELDALFTAFQGIQVKDPQRARRLFSRFKQGLERHIGWEEEILFPIFEERTEMLDRGPTAVMRMEHRQIKDCLAEIQDRLVNGSATPPEAEERLVALLRLHNNKEEAVLYPWIDEALSAEERRELVRRMEALPAARV
jgi:regulator of cell morphogenesis and NO signaling